MEQNLDDMLISVGIKREEITSSAGSLVTYTVGLNNGRYRSLDRWGYEQLHAILKDVVLREGAASTSDIKAYYKVKMGLTDDDICATDAIRAALDTEKHGEVFRAAMNKAQKQILQPWTKILPSWMLDISDLENPHYPINGS